MCFLEHLKLTTCAKIVPMVVLLASSSQGIPCSKGKGTSHRRGSQRGIFVMRDQIILFTEKRDFKKYSP